MGQIEERTVTKVGGGSLMVCLPKPWLRYYHIGPGDKVVLLTNGEIHIRPKKRIKPAEGERVHK